MRKAVFFDLDDTLYPMAPCAKEALARAAAYAEGEMGLDRVRFMAEHDAVLAIQLSSHVGTFCYHSRFIRFQLLCERLGLPVHHASRLANAYWEGYLETVRPFEGVAEVLRSLREGGLKLGIGTNMTADWQLAKLERLGLVDSFDWIVTSEEAGVEKPDGAFFRYCLEKAGVTAGECLFVGDNLVHDVRGALAAGLEALWLQPDPVRRASEDVASVAAFREIAGRVLGR